MAGCGDIGRRVVALLADRYRIVAVARSAASADALHAAGVVPIAGDLDDRASLHRLGGIAPIVLHLAPPQPGGLRDERTRALVASLRGVETLVYVSTSGVYGDARGAVVDETRAVAPSTDRAVRRVDAERVLRAWARTHRVRLAILRAPGIYAADRLPVDRVAEGLPALVPADDVRTNHVHADDLARLVVVAVARAASQRVYHASDDSALFMGEWLDLVADRHGLPRPPRVARAQMAGRVSTVRASFLSESRRLSNERAKAELGFVFRYPTVVEGLRDVAENDEARRSGPRGDRKAIA